MRWNLNKRVFAPVVVGVLIALACDIALSEGAAPPLPWRTLAHAQQVRLGQLESELQQALATGDFVQAVQRAREIASLCERWQGKTHAETLAAGQALKRYEAFLRLPDKEKQQVAESYSAELQAAKLEKQHKYQPAEALRRQALAIRRKVLGEEHPETATTCNNLAVNLNDQGKYAQAQPLFEQALAIRRKVLGEEHPLTASAFNNVAFNLDAQGKYAQAQPLYEKALAIRRKVLGENHAQTATSYNNVGSNLNDQGKYAQAQPYYEKALVIWRKTLGEEHSLTAAGYNNVASNLDDQGKHVQAQPLYEKALMLRRKVLGEEHPHTAISYNNVAANLSAQGKHAQAQPLYEKALALRRKVLGEDHPLTATGYNNVANNLNAQDNHTQAQPLYEKALLIRRKVLGEEHPYTADSVNGVATNLNAQGKYALAQPLFEQALAIRRKALGEEHPDTARSYEMVAQNLDAQGKHAQAQPLHEKALAICRKVLGEEHPQTADRIRSLAVNLNAQRKHAKAQPLFERALAIHRKVLGEEHPTTASSFNALGFNRKAQGEYAQAELLFERALAIRRKVLGEESYATAVSWNNVAFNLQAQGKYAQAQPRYEKALAIWSRLLGEEHPTTALSQNNLAFNLWEQKKFARAVHLIQASLLGQEAARYHGAPSGFDRAVASQQASPHTLLAVGLAHFKQPRNAFRHAEASLSRGLLDDLYAAATPEEVRQADSLYSRLDRLDGRLLPLFGGAAYSADQKALRQELFRQRRQILSDMARLTAEASVRSLLPLADIQKQLPPDAALVLWLDVPGSHLACVVRTRSDPVWVRLPGTGENDAWTDADLDLPDRLYRLLQEPNPRSSERQRLSAALARQRLEPLQPHMQAGHRLPAVRQLLVVPIGWAGMVPLEILDTGYRISYVPSGSVFARLRQRHRPVEASSLLALGDPVFTAPTVRRPEPPRRGVLLTFVQPGGSASRGGLHAGDVLLQMGDTLLASIDDLKKALSSGGGSLRYWRQGQEDTIKLPGGPLGARLDPRPIANAVAAWRASGSSLVLRGPDPVPLPGTHWEVQALARLVPKATTLLGSDASEQRLDELAKTKQLKSYRLIHLATHGLVDQETPGRSTLLLARDHLPDPLKLAVGQKNYTGELTVSAIRDNWQLDADLVVLSACKTALGKEGRGDGLLGFAQAFLQCGARSVVLSRWEADDTATALLMLRFYENLLGAPSRNDLKSPLPRAEALDEAKQWLRQLSKRDAETLAAALRVGKLAGTGRRGTVVEVEGKDRPKVKLPEGDRPYVHPFYWAAFVFIGDPD